MDPVFDESANTITLDRRVVDALQDDELIAYIIDKSQALKQLESFSEGKQADIRFKNIAQNTAFFALLGLLAGGVFKKEDPLTPLNEKKSKPTREEFLKYMGTGGAVLALLGAFLGNQQADERIATIQKAYKEIQPCMDEFNSCLARANEELKKLGVNSSASDRVR
jgi:hypothetical protein